jgi:hypothetical protein
MIFKDLSHVFNQSLGKENSEDTFFLLKFSSPIVEWETISQTNEELFIHYSDCTRETLFLELTSSCSRGLTY